MAYRLRTSPETTPKPASSRRAEQQPRQKGGRFGKKDGSASATRKTTERKSIKNKTGIMSMEIATRIVIVTSRTNVCV